MTTIRDIAREACCSVSTVSRVLAGHPDVSPGTAAAVQAVIDARQFSVNRNASNLKRAETTVVLVMVKGRYNLLFAAMLEQVQRAVTATGYTVVIEYLDEDDNEVAAAERLVPEIKPRGVIFLGADAGHIAQAQRLGADCPAVVLTNSVAVVGRPAVSSVTTHDRTAAQAAVTYLLDHGHRRIGVIGGDPAVSTISQYRREGVLLALAGRGIAFDEAAYVATQYRLDCGFQAAQVLVERAPDITAIYAMSDIMALGARRALYERGLDVPGDISLMGHDGIELAAYVVPRLVTIRQPQAVMAQRGVEILMAHIAGDPTPKEEFVPVDIVPGESVRAIG